MLEKISKVDEPLVREQTQITNIRNKRGTITTDPMDIKIRKEYCKQLYAHKYENIQEMDKLFERHNLPKLTKKPVNINMPTCINE